MDKAIGGNLDGVLGIVDFNEIDFPCKSWQVDSR